MTNDSVKSLVFGAGQKDLAALALGTSTTETAFANNGNSAANPAIAAVPAVLTLPDVASIAASGQPTPVFYWDNGKPFMVQAWGICTTGTSANLSLKLYQIPASAIAALTTATAAPFGGTLIATAGPQAVNSTTGKFLFQAELQWDSVSKLLHGNFFYEINLLPSPPAFALTTAATTLAQDADLNFLLSATLSSGNAANVVICRELSVQGL